MLSWFGMTWTSDTRDPVNKNHNSTLFWMNCCAFWDSNTRKPQSNLHLPIPQCSGSVLKQNINPREQDPTKHWPPPRSEKTWLTPQDFTYGIDLCLRVQHIMCVYIYIYIYYMYTRICTCTCMYTCMYVCMYVMYVRYVCMYVCMCVCMYEISVCYV